MQKTLTFAAALLLVAFAGASALGTTYYVATNGSDGNPGTSALPWATIQYAVQTIAAGDTILVKPGTYAGCRIEFSGTSGAPKTLAAETAGTVVLNSLSAQARHSGVLEIENYNAAVEYWVIEGLECDGVGGLYRPIDVRNTETQMNSHITIRNCVAHNGVSTGIFNSFTNYALIENCTSYSNGEHSIYVNNSADYGVLRGNDCGASVANGIHMNGDSSLGGDGVMSGWLVEDNVCHNNPATGINCDGIEESTFRNNLIYEFGNKGITWYAVDGAVCSRYNRAVNNTVLSDSGGLIGYYCVFLNDSRKLPAPVGNRVFNNILYNYRTATNRGSICITTSSQADFQSDYNVVMEYFGIDDNKTVLNFSQWQALGYDVHSIQAADTALFTDAANHVYTLKTGSPAIDAGTTLTDVTDDILGTSRPQGSAYDIGCYEAAGGPPADLVITTTSLPGGTVSVAYSQNLAATGGVTPYSWSVYSGSLPAGLSLSSGGAITGTPTATGTSNFTVQVTDSQAPADTDTQALSITIAAAPVAPTITTTSLPSGTRGQAYSATVQATGGTLPYTWTKVSGTLPNGLTLNPSTGVISGTPTKKATFSFTIRCTDANSQYDEQALSITIS